MSSPVRKFREAMESLLIAGGLALVIRGFVLEAFVVPTGSMAPAIYGRNLSITCPECDHQFAIKWGWGPSRRPEIKKCPRCGKPIQPTYFAFSRGDRLLVNKFLHRMRGLSRWEIVVFWCPDPSIRKNYIKRLVGLPGEEVQVKDGDLFVNGEIERKPREVQETMWVSLSDDDFGGKLWAKSWELESGQCDIGSGVLTLLGPGGERAEMCLKYSRPIDDLIVYNAGNDQNNGNGYPPEEVDIEGARSSYGGNPVGDIKVEVETVIADGAAIVIDLTDNRRPGGTPGDAALRFIIRSGPGVSTISNAVGKKIWWNKLNLTAGPHVIECANVDAALHLVVDGEPKVTHAYEPVPEISRPAPSVGVGAMGGRVDLTRLALYRDVHYCSINSAFTRTYGVDSPYHLSERTRDPETGEMIGENEYFFLGDNSRSSRDCRMLDLADYPIVEKYIRGKALVRFWPPRRIGLIE